MKRLRILWLLPILAIACVAAYYFQPYDRLPPNTPIDRIVVLKSKHLMLVYSNGVLLHSYHVALGKNPNGPKQYEGDQRTPEGEYVIYAKDPNSAFHKNLGISFPNAADLAAAKKWGKPTGGDIKIHGLRNDLWYIGRFQRWRDWTNGCVALTNEEVDDVYAHTAVGTPITIQP